VGAVGTAAVKVRVDDPLRGCGVVVEVVAAVHLRQRPRVERQFI
jgi:hypothetical protein